MVHDSGAAPDFLVVGHITRDLLPDGAWRLGGTVVFAALTAARLGKRPAIVTSGPPDVLEALRAVAPDVPVAAVPSDEATTFENTYDSGGHRRQHLRGRAAPLTLAAVPEAWRGASLVLLAPLAQEVARELAQAFPSGIVAATPQGWLRRWDAGGLVTPGPWTEAHAVLPHLAALIMSDEDLIPEPADELDASAARTRGERMIASWAATVPIVAITQGSAGAELWTGGTREHFPAYPVREVDPTGAGDVFAAAFLCRWQATHDPRSAMDFANCMASFVVECEGPLGIPELGDVEARMRAAH